MWTAVDGVIVWQTAVHAEVAPLIEVNGSCVGSENMKIDSLAVILFTRREVRQQTVQQQ